MHASHTKLSHEYLTIVNSFNDWYPNAPVHAYAAQTDREGRRWGGGEKEGEKERDRDRNTTVSIDFQFIHYFDAASVFFSRNSVEFRLKNRRKENCSNKVLNFNMSTQPHFLNGIFDGRLLWPRASCTINVLTSRCFHQSFSLFDGVTSPTIIWRRQHSTHEPIFEWICSTTKSLDGEAETIQDSVIFIIHTGTYTHIHAHTW